MQSKLLIRQNNDKNKKQFFDGRKNLKLLHFRHTMEPTLQGIEFLSTTYKILALPIRPKPYF